jgi:hypothetical protein
MKVWSATLELRHGPSFYGGQQWGILGNEQTLDPAISRVWQRPSMVGKYYNMQNNDLKCKEALTNLVPAVAVIQGG